MILSWKCEHIIIRQKSFAECQKSKQPIIQYLKCWEDKTKKSYNITLKSKTSTPPPFLNSRYPPLLYFCSVFPVDDWDWASPGTSSLCGCTSVGAAEAGQCSGSCHHQHGRTTCQSINPSIKNCFINLKVLKTLSIKKMISIGIGLLKSMQHVNGYILLHVSMKMKFHFWLITCFYQ